jgi:hypothetical protein
MIVKVFSMPREGTLTAGTGELFDCDSGKFRVADATPGIGRANDAVPGFRWCSIQATLATDTHTAE